MLCKAEHILSHPWLLLSSDLISFLLFLTQFRLLHTALLHSAKQTSSEATNCVEQRELLWSVQGYGPSAMWVRHFHGIYHADKEQLPCTEAQDVAEVTETLVSPTLLITAILSSLVLWSRGRKLPGAWPAHSLASHTDPPRVSLRFSKQ